MSFPLFHRPGTLVLLDDDPDYLDALAVILPLEWHVRMFLRPTRCVYYMHHQPKLWEHDRRRQQTMVDLWRQGKPLIPQILHYWAGTPERYALTHVCVVDFSMPGMDGLQVLSELVDWPGARILLTGQADERVAVGAFNRGLIDQYIPSRLPMSQSNSPSSYRPEGVCDPALGRLRADGSTLWHSRHGRQRPCKLVAA
jgi:CheY-like chemotaxis protein